MVSKRCLEDVYHIQLSLSLCPKAWGICLIILGLIAIAAGTYDWYLIQNNADPEEFDTKTKIVL